MRNSNKLSVSDVIDIRRMNIHGIPVSEINNHFPNVGERYLRKIISGEKRTSVPSDQVLKGTGGAYELTADGRVWSNSSNKYLSVSPSGSVTLRQSGAKKTIKPSELVAKYFN